MTTSLIAWIIGLPTAFLAIAYTLIAAEVMAAKRRMRLH